MKFKVEFSNAEVGHWWAEDVTSPDDELLREGEWSAPFHKGSEPDELLGLLKASADFPTSFYTNPPSVCRVRLISAVS